MPKSGPKMAELRRTARQLENHDAKGEALRTKRNRLIFEAVKQENETERSAAEAGRVSPPYAHRCVQFEGNPVSGPKLDEQAAQKAA